MYWTKTPSVLMKLFPSLTWRVDSPNQNIVFLSFDDGPVAEVTDKLLEILNRKKVLATFFCLGENLHDNPTLAQDIKDKGHSIGYHGWQHINGWKSSRQDFIENVHKGSKMVESKLFRPPYGKIPMGFIKPLTKDFNVIMWDVMAGDFDPNMTVDKCVQGVLKNAKPGSIIVFHDNKKSMRIMLEAVPKLIDALRDSGYVFGKL